MEAQGCGQQQFVKPVPSSDMGKFVFQHIVQFRSGRHALGYQDYGAENTIGQRYLHPVALTDTNGSPQGMFRQPLLLARPSEGQGGGEPPPAHQPGEEKPGPQRQGYPPARPAAKLVRWWWPPSKPGRRWDRVPGDSTAGGAQNGLGGLRYRVVLLGQLPLPPGE